MPGHVLFIDSPWALTAISQAQFWPGVDLTKRGSGRVKGILSVDISDWSEPGSLTHKTNTAGSWDDRPDAVTKIRNLFLAADFVRTHTDLATMEGANEAARRAVNGILDATGSAARPCHVWNLHEPAVLAPFRALDCMRWHLHLPALSPFRVTESGCLALTDLFARGIQQAKRSIGDRG